MKVLEEKENVLLGYKKDLEQIKEVRGREYIRRVGREELGPHHANRKSILHSPQNGVPIIPAPSKEEVWQLRRILEKKLGLRSWIDNR